MRWVEGGAAGPHQRWTPAFMNDWKTFINAESGVGEYAQQQILDKMNELVGRYPAAGKWPS
jgi:hypothetical protein